MAVITAPARAKVNLTLEVLGRRPDGYHELKSLIAFADLADRLSLDTDAAPAVTVSGPFAGEIAGENLLAAALRLIAATEPRLRLGAVRLEKNIPVAAGLGGGSADAAALLRAVRRANPALQSGIDWPGLAARLGADVPVCVESRAAWVYGKGEDVVPLAAPLPKLDAVLVNPRASLRPDKTAAVFRGLAAPAIHATPLPAPSRLTAYGSRAALLAILRDGSNDLETAATAVTPEIAAVMAALAATRGVELVRLSGAGPTCFAVLPNRKAATAAAATLAAANPAWWVVPVTIA
jgi:4-diphosphocytidyl-2-C-methyl-D-erythritol kinase